MGSLSGLENFAHVPVFAGFSALLYILLSKRSALGDRPALVAVVCVAVGVAVGVTTEVLQWASGTRAAEMSDLYYDVAGIAVGIGVAAIGLRITTRPVLAGVVVVGVVVALFALPKSDRGSTFSYRSAGVEQRCRESTPSTPFGGTPTDVLAAEPLVRYGFEEGAGAVVHDDVGGLDLVIGDTSAASWEPEGGLSFDGDPHRTGSKQPAHELSAALVASDEVSIEAWFVAASLPQRGPVRLATVSSGTEVDETNLHLGIEGNSVSFRVSTDCDYFNQATSGEELVAGELHHVVATYRPGVVTIFVDGSLILTREVQNGVFETWDLTRRLYLADEATADRTFSGTLYRVAVYDRELSSSAVVRLYAGGSGS